MPYGSLPDEAFWKLCRDSDDRNISALYKPRFRLTAGNRIATAGSCFAQHFGNRVRSSALRLVDVEPKPAFMSEDAGRRFGYGIYSARYGNIYTARQLRQLVDDCRRTKIRQSAIWEQDGRFYDGLRPGIEPEGYADRDELVMHRKAHLARVREMFKKSRIFVFTLGLTEAWQDRASGTVFPMAPGTVAGRFDRKRHGFMNFNVAQVVDDLTRTVKKLRRMNRNIRILLTVSPVPLTATASGNHVVQATTLSKSILRAAASEITERFNFVDYFPSYEIITNPMFGAKFFDDNLRTVTQEGVDTVMSVFFGAHDGIADAVPPTLPKKEPAQLEDEQDDLICEEVLLEEFANR